MMMIMVMKSVLIVPNIKLVMKLVIKVTTTTTTTVVMID